MRVAPHAPTAGTRTCSRSHSRLPTLHTAFLALPVPALRGATLLPPRCVGPQPPHLRDRICCARTRVPTSATTTARSTAGMTYQGHPSTQAQMHVRVSDCFMACSLSATAMASGHYATARGFPQSAPSATYVVLSELLPLAPRYRALRESINAQMHVRASACLIALTPFATASGHYARAPGLSQPAQRDVLCTRL